jgi:hypothetical protein
MSAPPFLANFAICAGFAAIANEPNVPTRNISLTP